MSNLPTLPSDAASKSVVPDTRPSAGVPHRVFRLRWQLLLSYVPLILLPIVVVGFSIRGATERGVAQYVTNQRAIEIARLLGSYYELNGNSWRGLDMLLRRVVAAERRKNPPNAQPDQGEDDPDTTDQDNGSDDSGNAASNAVVSRLSRIRSPIVMADATTFLILGSIGGPPRGRIMPVELRAQSVPVEANDTTIAYLYINVDPGQPSDEADIASDLQRQALIDTVTRSLVVAGLVSAVSMVFVGVWLSHQLTAPIRRLREGVARLGAGQWRDPLPIRTGNEIGQLTQAFNQMAGEITRQERLRRQMVADIAHDLRTPLSVMSLEVEAIRDGLQTPEHAAISLNEEIVTLRKLVDDLHTLSLLDAGQITLQTEPTPLDVFLSGIHSKWRPIAERAEHDLTIDPIPPNLIVAIDGTRMRQVMGNLLSNAIQHTQARTVIHLSACLLASGEVEISVQDNGEGIPTTDLPHIFDRFYRADKSRGRKKGSAEKGSGLGLSICYQLVQLHGGKLMVESEPGKGTRFRVVLPRVSKP